MGRPLHPLLKRLPLLVFVAVGFWLYQGPWFPQPRKLVWQTGAARGEIRRVELQLWDEGGVLLKRDQHELRHGAPPELLQEVSLREGGYDARFVIDREGRPQETGRHRLRIGEADTYHLALGRE